MTAATAPAMRGQAGPRPAARARPARRGRAAERPPAARPLGAPAAARRDRARSPTLLARGCRVARPALRERLGRADRPPRRAERPSRTARRRILAAALALASARRAARLDRPRRRDRRPGRRGAGRVARRPGGGRRARAADRARLRAERARRRRDGGPRRRARGLAERPRPDPRRERPGAPPAHDRARRPARPSRVELAVGGAAAPRTRCSRELLDLGYAPVARGRRPRRVRPARRHRRRLPAVGAAAGPDRVLRRRDRLAAGLRPDRPADGRPGRARSMLLPASEFLAPARRRGRAPRRGSAAAAAKLPERLAADLARFEGDARRRERAQRTTAGRVARRRRGRGLGRRSSPRRPASTTSTRRPCSSSTSPATSPRPPSSCGARPTSGAPSSIEAGDLPKDWPSTYLGPRDWKTPARRRPDARADLGVGDAADAAIAGGGLSSGDLFGWREPQPARRRAARRSPRRSSAGRRDGARIVLATDQAPRLAELLDEAGHPAARRPRAARRRRPAPSPSSSGA